MDPSYENGSPEFRRGYVAGLVAARRVLVDELTEWLASTREDLSETKALLAALSGQPYPPPDDAAECD